MGKTIGFVLATFAALSGCAQPTPASLTSPAPLDLTGWTANGNTTQACPGIHCDGPGPFAFLVPFGHPEQTWGFVLRGPHALDGARADLKLDWTVLASADADDGARSVEATPASMTRLDERFLIEPAPRGGSVKLTLIERDLPDSTRCADGTEACHRHAWCLSIATDAEHWFASSWMNESPEWPCPRVGTPDQSYILARA